MDMSPLQVPTITLRPATVALALALTASLLALTSLALEGLSHLTGGMDVLTLVTGREHSYGIRGLFSLNQELNVPSLFSTGLLLFASLLLLVITLHERNRGARDVAGWAILSAGFLLMAIDETVSLHERLIEPMRELLGPGTHGIFFYAWVIPGFAVVLVLGALFLPFLARLPAATRFIFILAATFYLSGAMGMELVNGRYAELHGTEIVYHAMVTAEEGLEMAGVIVFIYGLLKYLAEHHPHTHLAVNTGAEAPSPSMVTVKGLGDIPAAHLPDRN